MCILCQALSCDGPVPLMLIHHARKILMIRGGMDARILDGENSDDSDCSSGDFVSSLPPKPRKRRLQESSPGDSGDFASAESLKTHRCIQAARILLGLESGIENLGDDEDETCLIAETDRDGDNFIAQADGSATGSIEREAYEGSRASYPGGSSSSRPKITSSKHNESGSPDSEEPSPHRPALDDGHRDQPTTACEQQANKIQS